MSKSNGGLVCIVFVTAICPNCSTCVALSAKKILKLCSKIKQKIADAPKPIVTCKN